MDWSENLAETSNKIGLGLKIEPSLIITLNVTRL